MSSNARIFFAGVGTTFVVLAVGFGGGLMMASSMLQDPTGRAPSAAARLAPVRVILPTSAEPAQPPQPAQPMTPASPAPGSVPQAQQVEGHAPVEKQIEKPAASRAEAIEQKHLRRSAERRAKKLATARARQQLLEQQRREREPGIIAFGGDEQPRVNGFFGN